MKSFTSPVICILFLGTTLPAQSQSLLLPTPLSDAENLEERGVSGTRQTMGTSLLRLSHSDPYDEHLLRIELTSLPLLEPGPSIFFDCPDPLLPGSGAIRLQPGAEGAGLRLLNESTSDEHILRIDLGDPVVPNFRPSVVLKKPLISGPQAAIVLGLDDEAPKLRIQNLTPSIISIEAENEPGLNQVFETRIDLANSSQLQLWRSPAEDLVLERFFDITTPKLRERISSDNPMVDNFFDFTFDLNSATETRTLGDPVSELQLLYEYEKSTPKFTRRVLSTEPLYADSFFDIAYDFSTSTETRSVGDPASALQLLFQYEKAIPKLTRRILSTDPLYVDSFFDIVYNLGTGTGKVAYQDLSFTQTFEPSVPRIKERISSGSPSIPDIFEIKHDIAAGTEVRSYSDPIKDLSVTKTFDKELPKLTESISSTKTGYETHLFTNTHDLDAGSRKIQYIDLGLLDVFEPNVPKVTRTISSLNPMFAATLFETAYDLSAGSHGTSFQGLHDVVTFDAVGGNLRLLTVTSGVESGNNLNWAFAKDLLTGTYDRAYQDLHLIETFDPDLPTIVRRAESSDPAFNGRYLEVKDDISTELIALQLTSAGFPGLEPLTVGVEFDGTTRTVKETTTDTDNGIMVTLERRLSPSNPSLALQGSLLVNGGTLSSETGPLTIVDDTQIFGFLTINGGLQVTGPKAFRIDHPLDPEHKFLFHSCVESPDMMNIYNGNNTTDEDGLAAVQLPDYFEALNADFRYQLTCIGQFAQAIVKEKIKNNIFVIQTDKPNVEVSWQVTGIRQDPAALHSGYAVEVPK